MNRTVVGILLVSLLLLIGGASLLSSHDVANVAPAQQCVTHGNNLSMHIHPSIQINLNGTPYPIPANIGITSACMMSVHTHDGSGTIHLEYPSVHDFTLADFFANWGQPFNSHQIFDKAVDDTNKLTMMVDGKESTDFEKLILKDGQNIVISYGPVTSSNSPEAK